jgi:hypothetical protein
MERATDVDRNALTARMVSLAAGVWLFISAFIWEHTSSQRTNSWIMGLIIAGVALLAMRMPQARTVNTIASVWLFISVFLLPRISTATAWSNAIVAIVVFAASMVGVAHHRPLPPARV